MGSVVFTAVMENPGLFGNSHDGGAEEESLWSLSEGRASEPVARRVSERREVNANIGTVWMMC